MNTENHMEPTPKFLLFLWLAFALTLLSGLFIQQSPYAVEQFSRFDICIEGDSNTEECYVFTEAGGFPHGFLVDYSFVGSGDEHIPGIFNGFGFSIDYKYFFLNLFFYISILYFLHLLSLKIRKYRIY